MEHQNTQTGVGSPQDGNANYAPNLEKDLQELGISTEEPSVPDVVEDSPQTEDVDTHTTSDSDEPGKLKQERAAALKQAYIKNRQEKEARAKADFYEAYAHVADNPEHILTVHEANPELADQIAQKKWGMSYAQLLKAAQENQQDPEPQRPARTTVDDRTIDEIVEQKLAQRKTQTIAKKIDDYVDDFLATNDVEPNTPLYEQILEDFSIMQPKSLSQAKRMMTMIHKEATHGSGPTGNIGALSSVPASTSRGAHKASNYDEAYKWSKALGLDLTEDDFQKFTPKQ